MAANYRNLQHPEKHLKLLWNVKKEKGDNYNFFYQFTRPLHLRDRLRRYARRKD